MKNNFKNADEAFKYFKLMIQNAGVNLMTRKPYLM